ncbi:DUF3996 domain-containing protein [Borrelia sp. BU AG58]|uniref:BAPKO_0422 family outer member beta-barrel protein n=1 Tax=Borrelia sp. BU AG58 TaxID=2887345 RepID=UPI001E3F920F|nr:DUF3996 domain-containing protein [Borrelia sp. BU AG58]UER67727.1 DUF3996 domain-containing protein [Borrelia sp. BU AG58]
MLDKKLLFVLSFLVLLSHGYLFSKETPKSTLTTTKMETPLNFQSRGKFGFGLFLPFPTGIEFSIKNFDISVGIIHISISNLFSKEFMFYTHAHYIFSDLRIVDTFFFFMGIGLFLEIGKTTEIYEQKSYSGTNYKIGLSIPSGLKYKMLGDNFEINIRTSPSLFVGQTPSKQFVLPIRGDLSIGIKVWIKS